MDLLRLLLLLLEVLDDGEKGDMDVVQDVVVAPTEAILLRVGHRHSPSPPAPTSRFSVVFSVFSRLSERIMSPCFRLHNTMSCGDIKKGSFWRLGGITQPRVGS